jgi:hypothetical protein
MKSPPLVSYPNRRSSRRGQRGSGLGELLIGVLLIAVAVFVWMARPVSLVAVGGFVIWAFLRKRKDLFSTATSPFLLSASIGLAVLTIAYFVLQLAGPEEFEPDALYEFEMQLIGARLALKDATAFAIPVYVAIIVGLTTLELKFPATRALKSFLNVTGTLGKVGVGMTAVLSFSLFSALPAHRWQQSAHQYAISQSAGSMAEFKIRVREEWDAVGRYLAAEFLAQGFERLDETQHAALSDAFRELATHEASEKAQVVKLRVQCEAPDGDVLADQDRLRAYWLCLTRQQNSRAGTLGLRQLGTVHFSTSTADREAAASKLAARQADLIGPAPQASVEEVIAEQMKPLERVHAGIKRMPDSLQEWEAQRSSLLQQRETVAAQAAKVSQASARMETAEVALKKVLLRLVPQIAGMDGIVGAYAKTLQSKFSERALDWAIRQARAQGILVTGSRVVVEQAASAPATTGVVEVVTRQVEPWLFTRNDIQLARELVASEVKLRAAHAETASKTSSFDEVFRRMEETRILGRRGFQGGRAASRVRIVPRGR